MAVSRFDPIHDSRWAEYLERHPNASVFHTPEWLRALNRTYGFHSVGLTTAAPREPLRNGLVFCQIRSLLTGCRLVSLPFADHCHPFVDVPLIASARGNVRSLLPGGILWAKLLGRLITAAGKLLYKHMA